MNCKYIKIKQSALKLIDMKIDQNWGAGAAVVSIIFVK